jgi:ABC-2 type transport system ATP-binding protein
VRVCDRYRDLAARLAVHADVDGIKFLDKESGVLVETRQPDAFYARLPALAREDGLLPREVYSDDDNLEAVFKYLVSQ